MGAVPVRIAWRIKFIDVAGADLVESGAVEACPDQFVIAGVGPKILSRFAYTIPAGRRRPVLRFGLGIKTPAQE